VAGLVIDMAALHNSFQPRWFAFIYSPVYIIRRALFMSIKNAAKRIDGVILDLGCGSKPYENLFVGARKYIGCDVLVSGHDHSTSAVDVFYDGNTLPFSDEAFDAVVSFETFEHVFNIQTVLVEINRVLKSDGTLFVTVPFGWGEHEAPYDFARYTSFGIVDLLEKHGFEVLSLEKTNTTILATWQIIVSYLYEKVFPRNRFLRRGLLVLLIAPLTSLVFLLNFVLPKSQEFFSNLVVLARKRQRLP
jgi:SAM-dependent methyltransferase